MKQIVTIQTLITDGKGRYYVDPCGIDDLTFQVFNGFVHGDAPKAGETVDRSIQWMLDGAEELAKRLDVELCYAEPIDVHSQEGQKVMSLNSKAYMKPGWTRNGVSNYAKETKKDAS